MTLSSSNETVQKNALTPKQPFDFSFPMDSTLETVEQKRRFELLRLAFFVLKLRKTEQRLGSVREESTKPAEHEERTKPADHEERERELNFHCNLLRHVIFQQVLTLIQLDARDQAMQIIDTCRK